MLHRNLRTAARGIVTSTRALAISAIALSSTSPASAGTNQLTLVGPEGGGILQVQFHPTNPSIAYALTNGGYYRSTDSGLNWSLVGRLCEPQSTRRVSHGRRERLGQRDGQMQASASSIRSPSTPRLCARVAGIQRHAGT